MALSGTWIAAVVLSFLIAKDLDWRAGWPVLCAAAAAVAPFVWRRLLNRLDRVSRSWPTTPLVIGRAAPAASALVLFLLLAMLLLVGVRSGGDTARYLDYGRKLLTAIVAVDFAALASDVFAVMYLFQNLIAGGAEWLWGAQYGVAVVVLNTLFFSVVVLCCFKTWQLEAQGTTVGRMAVALVLLIGCPDVVMWNYYVLSDVTFLFFVALFWLCLARAVLLDESLSNWCALAVAVASTFVRPTGTLHVAFWLITWVFFRLERRVTRSAVGALFVLVPFACAEFGWPYVLFLKGQGVGWASWLISDELFSWYQAGAVVCNRLETYLAAPTHYVDYVAISLYKLFYFFFPFRAGYSTAHNFLLAAYFPLLALLAWAGWKRLTAAGGRPAMLALLLALFSWLNGLFHSMLYVDYDWRYQIPAMLAAWLLAGFALIRNRDANTPIIEPVAGS